MQEEVGLQVATDGEFRRASWHMDFIYQLGGVTRVPEEQLTVEFHSDEGDLDAVFSGDARRRQARPRATRSSATTSPSCATRSTTAMPKLTIPSPSMVHYRGGRASIDPSVYPDLDAFWADLTAAYREEVGASASSAAPTSSSTTRASPT